MRIGIDYSPVAGERTGVGQYTHNLTHAIAALDRKNQYILYPFFYYIFDVNYREADFPKASNFKVALLWLRLPFLMLRSLWMNAPSWLKELLLGKVDIIHSNTFCAPRFRSRKKKLVVTIYDLTVLTHPECHKKANVDHCLKGTKDAIDHADAIIAISEHTRRDLIEHLDCPEELITVTHLAADPIFAPVEDSSTLEAMRSKYDLPEKYLLFIGSLEPRKNMKTLIKAYSRLPDKLKDEYSLVVAGARGWLNSDIAVVVKELGLEDRVHFTGYIDREDLSALYSGAAVFVYPSLYEGFGLPILEAMACGVPVVTSNTSSMPEVAGEAAMLVTPTDEAEMASAIERLLVDEQLRQKKRAMGLERASEFTWERCAKETLEVYRKVYASKRRAG